MQTNRTNGVLILVSTILVAGATACGGVVDGPAASQTAAAEVPARVVRASAETQTSWGISEWRTFKGAAGAPGRVEGVDEQRHVVGTIAANPLSSGDQVLRLAVRYADRQFEQQLQNGKLLAASGDDSLAPLIVAMGRDQAAAPPVAAMTADHVFSTEAVNACTQDWVNFGGATVGTIATCATVETGFGILLCCAMAGIAWDVAVIVLRDCWGI